MICYLYTLQKDHPKTLVIPHGSTLHPSPLPCPSAITWFHLSICQPGLAFSLIPPK